MLVNIPQLSWDLDLLLTEVLPDSYWHGAPKHVRGANYSISALRYWFIYHFLLAEHANCKHLSIAEYCAGRGELMDFINVASRKGFPAVHYHEWHAFDTLAGEELLTTKGYSAVLPHRNKLRRYDVAIVLVNPGNLHQLEKTVSDLKAQLNPNGIVIGTFKRPRFRLSEQKSAYSDNRVSGRPKSHFKLRYLRKIACKTGFAIDFYTGAYFGRDTGLVSGERSHWFRFNLMMGALLPCMAGELYWVFRK